VGFVVQTTHNFNTCISSNEFWHVILNNKVQKMYEKKAVAYFNAFCLNLPRSKTKSHRNL